MSLLLNESAVKKNLPYLMGMAVLLVAASYEMDARYSMQGDALYAALQECNKGVWPLKLSSQWRVAGIDLYPYSRARLKNKGIELAQDTPTCQAVKASSLQI